MLARGGPKIVRCTWRVVMSVQDARFWLPGMPNEPAANPVQRSNAKVMARRYHACEQASERRYPGVSLGLGIVGLVTTIIATMAHVAPSCLPSSSGFTRSGISLGESAVETDR